MPNTPANVAAVTAAYNKWQSELNLYEQHKNDTLVRDGVTLQPVVTKNDVALAYSRMQTAIREWEKPASDEDARTASKLRSRLRKVLWPKYK